VGGLTLTHDWVVALGLAVVLLAIVAGYDMHRQGRWGIGWALLILVLPPVGLVAWLCLRERAMRRC